MFFLLDSSPPGNYLEIQQHLLSLPQALKILNHCLLLGNQNCFHYPVRGQNHLMFRLLASQSIRNHCEGLFGNARYRMQQPHHMMGTRLVSLVSSAQGDGPGNAPHRPEQSLSLKYIREMPRNVMGRRMTCWRAHSGSEGAQREDALCGTCMTLLQAGGTH